MLKIFRLFKVQETLQVAACIIFVVAQVWLELKLPEYMSTITALVQTEGSAMSDIWLNGGYMLLCTLGSLVSAIAVGFFASRIGATFSARLRSMLFHKVDSFSMSEINKFSTSSLITRSTNDVTQIQMLIVMGLQMMIKAPIMAVWAIIKISGKSYEWTLATGVAVVFLLVLFGVLMALVPPKFKKMQVLTDNLNKVTRENLTGLAVVRAYNADSYQEAKFERANKELTSAHLFTARGMAIIMPAVSLVMSGLTLSIYWIGAVLINNAGMLDKINLFSEMMVFSQYAMQIIMSFMMITMLFVFMPRAAVSARRINEILASVSSINDGSISDSNQQKKGEIVFNNVSFKFPGAADYVLKNINFKVNTGETVAFIGSTGSGKSTLINLVPRFFDATDGEILVDGANVKDYTLEALYNKIGYIPQKAVLFSGSVKSNVAFGDNGLERNNIDEEVENSVKIAQGAEFVENMEGKYLAEISRGGTNISGGQKQRLSIARAIYRKPEILIFDDSFSALDYKTDRTLRSALKEEVQNTTTLIVAQRIGTIMDADKIVVLDEGEIVGIGKHRELLKDCKVYKEIAMSQLSEEELV